MDEKDHFEYLLEKGLIDHSEMKCSIDGCEIMEKNKPKFKIIMKENKTDGLILKCNGKVLDPNSGNDIACTLSRTPRSNSWFYKSKLKTG